jgi:hypothetical protein
MRERPNWRAALWLRRHRIRGKRKFIWSIVVLRLAFPAAAVVTVLRALTEPFEPLHFLLHVAANSVAAVLGGYVGGSVLWDLVVNRGGRGRSTKPPIARPATRPDSPPAQEDPPARRFEG